MVINDYLRIQQFYINRVLTTDIFDVVFQGDPFTTDIKPNILYLTSENHQIKRNYWMRNWMNALKPDPHFINASQISNKNVVINSGPLIGTINVILQYLDCYYKYYTKDAYKIRSINDQNVLNYLAHLGILSSNNIQYVIDDPNGFSSVIGMKYFHDKDHWNELGYVFLNSISKIYSLHVHQYDRQHGLKRNIIEICSPSGMPEKYFVRNL
jgi:hypothetical protein